MLVVGLVGMVCSGGAAQAAGVGSSCQNLSDVPVVPVGGNALFNFTGVPSMSAGEVRSANFTLAFRRALATALVAPSLNLKDVVFQQARKQQTAAMGGNSFRMTAQILASNETQRTEAESGLCALELNATAQAVMLSDLNSQLSGLLYQPNGTAYATVASLSLLGTDYVSLQSTDDNDGDEEGENKQRDDDDDDNESVVDQLVDVLTFQAGGILGLIISLAVLVGLVLLFSCVIYCGCCRKADDYMLHAATSRDTAMSRSTGRNTLDRLEAELGRSRDAARVSKRISVSRLFSTRGSTASTAVPATRGAGALQQSHPTPIDRGTSSSSYRPAASLRML